MDVLNKAFIEYDVDPQHRIVICTAKNTKWLFVDFLHNNSFNFSITTELLDKLEMQPEFWGRAVALNEDVWNEQEGKLLAYHRMRKKISKAMRKRMKTFKKLINRKMELFEEDFDNYMKKVDNNAARRLEIIKTFSEDEE